MGRLYGSWVRFRGWPRWVQIALVVVLVIVIIAVATSGSSKKPSSSTPPPTTTQQAAPTTTAPAKPSIPKAEADARSYITAHGGDAYRVQANVLDVQLAVGLFQKQATQANLNQMAMQAQTAHDNLDAIRTDFAGGFGNDELGTAELNAFSGANDLKNAMGALVSYAGAPNAATLAHFTTQYQTAVSEWNQGVRIIWRLAHRGKPPTV